MKICQDLIDNLTPFDPEEQLGEQSINNIKKDRRSVARKGKNKEEITLLGVAPKVKESKVPVRLESELGLNIQKLSVLLISGLVIFTLSLTPIPTFIPRINHSTLIT